MPNVVNSHQRNFQYSKTPEFADWMVASLQTSFVRVMRIHVSGDFYTNEYIHKWIDVVKRSPDTQFFAYTRSWRIDYMLPELIRLAGLPNMQLWWSIDRETGPAPTIKGIRRAYMAITDVDAQNAPNDCDLIFRDNQDTIMKRANGIPVCPTEMGFVQKRKTTCSTCGICWKQKDTRWEKQILEYLQHPATELHAPAA
jgi:hypothetical protein